MEINLIEKALKNLQNIVGDNFAAQVVITRNNFEIAAIEKIADQPQVPQDVD